MNSIYSLQPDVGALGCSQQRRHVIWIQSGRLALGVKILFNDVLDEWRPFVYAVLEGDPMHRRRYCI